MWDKHSFYYVTVWIQIISASTFFELRFSLFCFFFFGSAAIVDFVNCEQYIRALFTVPQITLFSHFLLKMGPTALFTHLKIISLQYFQFQFSVSAKISSIQTHPMLPCTERQNSCQVLTLHGSWKIYPKSCKLIHKWFNELPNKRLNTSIQLGKQLDLLIAQIGIYLSKKKNTWWHYPIKHKDGIIISNNN